MNAISNLFKVNLKSQSIIGISTIVFGVAAISEPFISSVFFSMLLAMEMCAVGITGVIWLFKDEETSTKIWMGILSASLVISSFFIYQLPGDTLLFPAGVLIAFFLLEGIVSIIYGIIKPRCKYEFLGILYGIICVVCAGLLIIGWPIIGMFSIGSYVGIKLIFLGIVLLGNLV